jgi:hypothetical protein
VSGNGGRTSVVVAIEVGVAGAAVTLLVAIGNSGVSVGVTASSGVSVSAGVAVKVGGRVAGARVGVRVGAERVGDGGGAVVSVGAGTVSVSEAVGEGSSGCGVGVSVGVGDGGSVSVGRMPGASGVLEREERSVAVGDGSAMAEPGSSKRPAAQSAAPPTKRSRNSAAPKIVKKSAAWLRRGAASPSATCGAAIRDAAASVLMGSTGATATPSGRVSVGTSAEGATGGGTAGGTAGGVLP